MFGKKAYIAGIGYYIPEKIMTNNDLEKIVDTSDEWITMRTGIKERRIYPKDRPGYEMGVNAAEKALENSGIPSKEIDLIITCTESPDYLIPATACIIQRKIGAENSAAFDMNAACSGFVYAMSIARQFIESGKYENIMIVACEKLSSIVDWEDRNTCVLFGDGAGAVILKAGEEGIITEDLGSSGHLGHNITAPCTYFNEEELEKRKGKKAHTIWMDGSEVFKFAVRIIASSVKTILKEQDLKINDIDYIIPHQANIRILNAAAKRLKMPMEKMCVVLDQYGNMSSASIPVTLGKAVEEGKIKKGQKLILTGFGGGLTWASILLKWV